ncbi:hypothetical protein [Streptomyces sp. BF23-19]|uniref:hypothetical protein n=1 Tax=Streptomyces TaxID=1883 RepID=UPI0034E3EA90|nr:hypothetical protein OG253_13155 [Streptomyces virginiae]
MLRALVAGLVLVAGLALPMVAPQPAQAVPPGTYAYVANFQPFAPDRTTDQGGLAVTDPP